MPTLRFVKKVVVRAATVSLFRVAPGVDVAVAAQTVQPPAEKIHVAHAVHPKSCPIKQNQYVAHELAAKQENPIGRGDSLSGIAR